MDRHRYITRSRRAFVRIKKANEPKARAASSLSGIRLKKVDEKNSMVAVFRSMARGLTIWVSQNKIGQHPFPPVDITAACSNNFRFKVSGAHERICYRVISLLSMPKVPRPCVRNRDPWLKLFSQEEQNVTFFRNKIQTRHRDGLKNRRKVTKKNQLG